MAEAAPAPGETSTLHFTRTLPASRERVFRAWTDPGELREWLAPEGAELVSATSDVRVGGDYRFGFRSPDGELVYVAGTYLEVDPPNRLVFTWLFEGIDRDDTLVTVVLRDAGADTEIVLTHEKLASDWSRAVHHHGWDSALTQLARLLTLRYT